MKTIYRILFSSFINGRRTEGQEAAQSRYLDEEGHVAELNAAGLADGPQLRPQGHQAAQVQLVTEAKVGDLQGSRHGLHHGLLEAWPDTGVT